jgi:hypothetical protein
MYGVMKLNSLYQYLPLNQNLEDIHTLAKTYSPV